jgi:chromosome segregation ATPase
MNPLSNLAAIITIVSSVGFGAIVTSLLSRRKLKAETRLADAESKLKDIETYSKMLQDFRVQLDYQAKQIHALQDKEIEYLKIIGNHQATERELRKRVSELETQVRYLKKQQHE